MAVFVLVAGAWHGGWAWRKLAPALRAEGHELYTPTLSGLGERAHLLSHNISLETHVQDIAGLLDYEDLSQVILVGHSYAGMVVSGAAHRAPGRVGHLVYLDAWFPVSGARSMEQVGRRFLPAAWSHLEDMVRSGGEGWLLPVPPVENPYNLADPAEARWYKERLTPHPWRTFQEPLPAPAANLTAIPRTYILCPEQSGFAPLAPMAAIARQQGWSCHEVQGGHAAMYAAADKLAEVLLSIAERVQTTA